MITVWREILSHSPREHVPTPKLCIGIRDGGPTLKTPSDFPYFSFYPCNVRLIVFCGPSCWVEENNWLTNWISTLGPYIMPSPITSWIQNFIFNLYMTQWIDQKHTLVDDTFIWSSKVVTWLHWVRGLHTLNNSYFAKYLSYLLSLTMHFNLPFSIMCDFCKSSS